MKNVHFFGLYFIIILQYASARNIKLCIVTTMAQISSTLVRIPPVVDTFCVTEML